eukprot:1161930-Pelagomonas_calceolata.AAC.6
MALELPGPCHAPPLTDAVDCAALTLLLLFPLPTSMPGGAGDMPAENEPLGPGWAKGASMGTSPPLVAC